MGRTPITGKNDRLARPPPERIAVESLSEAELVERALKERKDETGRPRFSVTLPDDGALEKFTAAIAGALRF